MKMFTKLKEFLAKHWNGEFPLWRAYWVNSVLLANITYLVTCLLLGLTLGVINIDGTLTNKTINLLSALAYVPFLGWAIVGTWRSATAYPGQVWGLVAKIVMGFAAFREVFEIMVNM
jgi:hypothetical protein